MTVAVAMLVGTSAGAAEQKYVLGARMGASNDLDAQFKTIITEVARAFSARNDEKIEVKWFNDKASFYEALKKNELDIVFLYSFDHVYDMTKNYGMEYMFTTSMFDAEKIKMCLFVKKSRPEKRLGELKGLTAATYNDGFEYALLRDLVGEAPETFFKSISPSPNGISLAYSLALDNVQASFINDSVVNFLRVNNPGPVKDIRSVGCTVSFPLLPFLASNRVPDDMRKRLTEFVGGMHKYEELKKYKAPMKMYGMKFVPVDANDYGPAMKIYEKALKNGWLKDFDKWVKYSRETK